jgi:hypothetical protein
MSRLKMFAFLPRRADVSKQYFHDHWRHPHGTWGRRISTVQRYVQSHRIDCSLLPPTQTKYDGVVEVWFDGFSDAHNMPNHPTYSKYLVPDEPNFIDMDKLLFIFAQEDIVRSGPDPNEEPGSADFAWREDQAPITVKLIQLFQVVPGIDRSSSDERAIGDSVGALRQVRSQSIPALTVDRHYFIRELWWPTLSAFEEGVERSPVTLAALLSDRANTTLLCQAERML